jgi:TM2 domain-containing membrane protein YozV
MTTDPYGTSPPDPNYASTPPNYDFPSGEPGYFPPPDRSEAASKKLAAGLTGILLGSLGVHKFILGYNTAGIIMVVTSVVCWTVGACLIFPLLGSVAMTIIGIIEGIIYLTKSDEEFYQTYMLGKKEWF